MFAEFDRPDWNGKSDKSIDVTEFEMGVVDLGLDLSTQQIKDVFHLVDKDGRACPLDNFIRFVLEASLSQAAVPAEY